MKWLVVGLLAAGAHFSFAAFAPTPAGRSWLLWPFALDARARPSRAAGLRPVLAGVAGVSFLGALLGMFGVLPAAGWPLFVLLATSASLGLYGVYFGPWALLPLAIDGLLLWGLLAQGWARLTLVK